MAVTLTINGQTFEALPKQTVLQAAQAHGIAIPTLCYHPDLTPVGSCRLCLVEVGGFRDWKPACKLSPIAGMVIRTESDALSQLRRFVLELLMRRLAEAGANDEFDSNTEFMRLVRQYSARMPECGPPAPRAVPDSDPNPFVRVDWNKCILCTRCVRACDEVQGRFVWRLGGQGANTRIVAGMNVSMLDAHCESCGACAAYCPTGALDDKPSFGSGTPEKTVSTTCPYCGVGCGFDLNVRGGRIMRVTSNPRAAVNGMSLCVKGRYGYEFVHHPDRLMQPKVRQYLLDGKPRPADRGPWMDVDWRTAVLVTASKLADIKSRFGPNAVGFLSSAKCTNEENYLVQKLARQVIGTNNIDHCARLCHASTVSGLAMSFGSGAMSNTMDDVANQAHALFIIGSNTTEQHPVFATRIRQAVLRRGIPLVVADPRKIDITAFATLHLRHRPGTDVALVNGLMHVVLANGWHNAEFIRERCEDFDDFAAAIASYSPERVAEITGLEPQCIRKAAELLARNQPMAVIWSMGITQHTTGVLNVLSLANLQMLLGNMGVPGGGVNPLRGQNNVQGACDMGALPNVLPGYQPVTDRAVREKFDAAWRTVANGGAGCHPQLGDQPGLTVTEMIEQAGRGDLRGLFILGENPAMTDPDLNHVRQCLNNCEFNVVQEIFPSETAKFADVLLAGTSWAEKDGTFTNTERRIQLVRRAIDPVGQSRPDWMIVADLAQRLLELEGRTAAGPHAEWSYRSPADVLDEIAELTPSYHGVRQSRLESGQQLFWPVTDATHPGTPILHVGKFTRGKGKFHIAEHLEPAELPDNEFPWLLTTGRVLYHWHGAEMTRRVRGLLEIYPQALIEISADDAAAIGLRPSTARVANDSAPTDAVRVVSRRGEVVARASVTDRVSPGLVFANFHFPGVQNVNNVTHAALDPVAKIPEYKICAVRLERC